MTERTNQRWMQTSNYVGIAIVILVTVVTFWILTTDYIEIRIKQSVSAQISELHRIADTRSAAADICVKLERGAIVDCIENALMEVNSLKLEQRNITAQERIAFWSKFSSITTFLAFLSVTGALYYTRVAARHSAIMAEESSKATIAASKTADATLLIVEHQAQAYLSITSPRFILERHDDDRDLMIVGFDIKNIGQAPASDFECDGEAKITLGQDYQYSANLTRHPGSRFFDLPPAQQSFVKLICNIDDMSDEFWAELERSPANLVEVRINLRTRWSSIGRQMIRASVFSGNIHHRGNRSDVYLTYESEKTDKV